MHAETSSVLAGVRVLDLTHVLSGPYCTMLLADQGAEVVKVEAPGRGEDARHLGPPFAGDASVFFVSVNRNKKSLTLDLKQPGGVSLLKRLASQADVLVENFRPGVADRLGIGYEAIAAVRPEIVYASISGFGQTGPYRDWPGYNIIVQALSGVMTTSGPDGAEPYPVGLSLGDIPAGMFAAFAIVSALFDRQRSGRGRRIDVAMLDSLVAMMENPVARQAACAAPILPFGRHHPSITPYGIFSASDGPFALAVGNDRLWRRFCEVVERPDLDRDPRYQSNGSRTEHAARLHAELDAILARRTAREWVDAFLAAGIPAAPVQSLVDLLRDPQIEAREMLVRVEQPGAGSVAVVGTPVRFSASPSPRYRPAPRLGDDVRDVLTTWLGMDEAAIRELERSGIV